jgi:hypothetical protein
MARYVIDAYHRHCMEQEAEAAAAPFGSIPAGSLAVIVPGNPEARRENDVQCLFKSEQ